MKRKPVSEELMAEMIAAVRADPAVGVGSMTSVDEAMDDEDLREMLSEPFHGRLPRSPKSAVRLARRLEDIRVEQSLNFRLGQDDDPEMLAAEEWRQSLRENPL